MVAETETLPQTADDESPKSRRRWLLPMALTVVLGGAGFASSYLGLWSPLDLMQAQSPTRDKAPETAFIDIPTTEVPLPGSGRHAVIIAATIQTTAEYAKEIEHDMPRIQSAFNEFLSGIDPAAFEKRGVLEIIRAELQTRARQILGDDVVQDLLIKEFRLK